MTKFPLNEDLTVQATDDVPKGRTCLKCRQVFDSTGFGDRICRRCKGSKVWQDGIPSTFGSPSKR